MNELSILGILIVGSVFGLGFIILGVIMFLDKTPRTYIRKPPKWLKNTKD